MKLGTNEISEVRMGSRLIPAAYFGTRPLAGMGATLPPFIIGSTYAAEVGDLVTAPVYAAAEAAGCKAIHPSVVFSENGWNGYKYWMAMTPYKAVAGSAFENPSILCSNDGITWAAPTGFTNPVIGPLGGSDYNADTWLMFNGSKLLMVWNQRTVSGTPKIASYYSESSDGVNWTERTKMLELTDAQGALASPSLHLLSDGTWAMWVVDTVASPRVIDRWTATALTGPWTKTTCTVESDPDDPWHLDVQRYRGKWIMLLNTEVPSGTGLQGAGTYQLALLESADGLTWTTSADFPEAYTSRGQVEGSTNFGCYKSALVLDPSMGEGIVGKIWAGAEAFTDMRVADITTPTQLSPSYIPDAVQAAIGNAAGYVVGDTFDRANNASLGTADKGGAWSFYGASSAISSNKVARAAGGASTNYIAFGATKGVVGSRFSLPWAGSVALILRCDFARNLNRLILAYNAAIWSIQLYNGAAWVYLARWRSPKFGDGTRDPLDVVARFDDRNVIAYFNGRPVANVTMTESDFNSLDGNLKVGLFMNDTVSTADLFFAHQI